MSVCSWPIGPWTGYRGWTQLYLWTKKSNQHQSTTNIRVPLLRRMSKSHLLLKSTLFKFWVTCSAVQSKVKQVLSYTIKFCYAIPATYLFPLLFFALFVDNHETKINVAETLLLASCFTESITHFLVCCNVKVSFLINWRLSPPCPIQVASVKASPRHYHETWKS